MRTSRIFTNAEMQSIEEREKGNKSDETGIFSSRTKPKISEMLNDWFPKKKQLTKLIKVK